jgi:serine/threonine protein kinase
VPIYGAGHDCGRLYIAMRHVDGTDLRTLMAECGPLDPPAAVRLLAQVAEALDAAHARGLVHRDIKPANVFVTVDSEHARAYLTDFGIAMLLGRDQLTAPNQLMGKRELH